MSGGNWQGQPRDGAQPHRLISPYDRKPVRSTTQATDLPGGDDRLPVNLAAWCGWVVVEDDGGADLIVRSGRAGNDPTSSPTGSAVWIGDGQCSISYGATAPSRAVRLVGCTGEDASILAASALAAALAALTAVSGSGSPNGTKVEQLVGTNVANQPYQPPAGTVSTVVTYDSDNTANMAVSNVDTAAKRVVIGAAAPLSSVTFFGSNPILIHAAVGDIAIFINATRS